MIFQSVSDGLPGMRIVAAMGFFGAKHCDKSLALAYTVSNCLWFVYMGAVNMETLGTYFYCTTAIPTLLATPQQVSTRANGTPRSENSPAPASVSSPELFSDRFLVALQPPHRTGEGPLQGRPDV